jgi:hypothetical protein
MAIHQGRLTATRTALVMLMQSLHKGTRFPFDADSSLQFDQVVLLTQRVPLITHDSYASSNGFLGSRFLLIGGAQKMPVSFEAFCEHIYIVLIYLYGIIYFREKKALILKNLERRTIGNGRSKHPHTGIPNDAAIPHPPIEDGRLLAASR